MKRVFFTAPHSENMKAGVVLLESNEIHKKRIF